MSYNQTIIEILLHIAKKHPEILNHLPLTDDNFEKDLGFKGTFYYSKNLSCELAFLCDKYGSDKGEIKSSDHPYSWPSHTYTDYYSRLWGHCREAVTKVFECGLGTNNLNFPSSMGSFGKPGASLRVWRNYFPNAMIYGADIDKGILFSEDRIKTFYIDQLNPEAIKQYWLEVSETNFDFIIDDGLHTFQAGSCLFTHSIEKLSSSGIYVIEDVSQDDLKKYKYFFKTQNYLVDYVSTKGPNFIFDNNLVVVRKV